MRDCFFEKILWVEIIGPVAEWLGKGLQNLVQRFNSAPDLINSSETLMDCQGLNI